MITLKIPYETSEESRNVISAMRRQYSCVVRYAYNRFLEGKTQKETRAMCKELKNIDAINSWYIDCAILEGKDIFVRNKCEKIIFGGKKSFGKRISNKITNEELKKKRAILLNSQGERRLCGNRMFDLKELTNNVIIFKASRKLHIKLTFPSQRKNYKRKIEYVELACAVKELTVSVRLSEKFIYLSYEEPRTISIARNEKIYMGIDLNPNHIGMSIFEDDNVICVKSFDFSKITEKINLESNVSYSARAKRLNGKLRHELIECAKEISQNADKYNIKFVFIENLKNINTKDSKYGHKFNRLTRCLWKRDFFTKNLTKRLELLNIKIFKVNPMYSSVIGNLQHNYFDPCNAACEIARRGYEVIIKKTKKFYPDFNAHALKDRWKEYFGGCEAWKNVFAVTKNAKLRYRVPLEDTVFESLKMKSRRSLVTVYNFV